MLAKLVPDIQKTAELVPEITAASAEQTTGTSQINKALQQLNHVIQQNSSSSEEMGSTAEELASQAEILQSSVAFFKTGQTNHAPASQNRQSSKTRPIAQPWKPHVPHSVAKSLSNLKRSVKGGNEALELTSTRSTDFDDR